MNISIVSPHSKRAGISTVASFLALEYASRNKRTCLTNVSRSQDILKDYFGVSKTLNSSAKPSQILNLIKNGSISPSDVPGYCYQADTNLWLFLLENSELPETAEEEMARFSTTRFPFDYVIYDIDIYDFDSPAVRTVMANSDCIVFLLTQSHADLLRFKQIQERVETRLFGKPYVVCINRYCDYISNIREVAAKIGIENPGNWKVIRFNPYIQRFTDYLGLKSFYKSVKERTPEVAEVAGDIQALANCVIKLGRKNHLKVHKKEEIKTQKTDDRQKEMPKNIIDLIKQNAVDYVEQVKIMEQKPDDEELS